MLAIASCAYAPGLFVIARSAFAEPGAPCEADSCVTPLDPGPRPWIFRDECREENDIVGYRRCTSFGQWAAPAAGPHFAFEVGIGRRHLVAPAVAPADLAARIVGGGLPSSDAEIGRAHV